MLTSYILSKTCYINYTLCAVDNLVYEVSIKFLSILLLWKSRTYQSVDLVKFYLKLFSNFSR
jgi:hypothetical protein